MEQDYTQPVQPMYQESPHNPYDPLPQDNEPLWIITGVADMPGFDPKTGAPMNMKRIDFTLHDGDSGFLEIPARDFNPEKIQDMVHHEASKILRVKQLQGPPKATFYGYSPNSNP